LKKEKIGRNDHIKIDGIATSTLRVSEVPWRKTNIIIGFPPGKTKISKCKYSAKCISSGVLVIEYI
jgi:hypothetical protein